MVTTMSVYSVLKDLEEKTRKNLPKVLAAKKARYLKAINKPELINFDYSENDANINIKMPLLFSVTENRYPDELFDDSIVIDAFENYKKPSFSLDTYLECVKAFLLDYLGLESIDHYKMSKVYVFILAHARDFDDPTKDLFEFKNGNNDVLEASELENIVDKKFVGDSNYVTKLSKLIDELRVLYTEEKYQQLNINVTYLLFVAARSLVKEHSHLETAFVKKTIQKPYTELCPRALDETLPTISKKCSIYTMKNCHHLIYDFITLIFYSFKRNRSLTSRILTVTCMQYYKHTGLQMYSTFNRVVELYNINESQLWDHLIEEAIKFNGSYSVSMCESLMNLADFYHNKHVGENNGKSYELFPYCRVLKNSYYISISAKQNLYLTYILVLLVDMKLGLENSFLRNAAWVNQRNNVFLKENHLARLVKKAIEK